MSTRGSSRPDGRAGRECNETSTGDQPTLRCTHCKSREHLQCVVKEHSSPTCRVRLIAPFDSLLVAVSGEAFVNNSMAYLASLPAFHNRWEPTTANIDGKKDVARVFQIYATSGAIGYDLARLRSVG